MPTPIIILPYSKILKQLTDQVNNATVNLLFMTENIIVGTLFILIGAFCLACVFFNWNWYWSNSRAVKLVKMISKKGAQIFYGVLGIFLIIAGLITVFI